LVSWAPSGCRGGVDCPLGPIWPPWGRGRSPAPCLAAVGASPVLCAPSGRVGAWPIPWVQSGRRGGLAAVGAWLIP